MLEELFICASHVVAQETKGGDKKPAEVAPQKYPVGGDGNYEDYTDRCTEGGIRYGAKGSTPDA